MPKFTCNWAVGHDGKNYAPGDEINVSGKAADALLASGAIGKPEKKTTADADSDGDSAADDLI